MHIIFHVWNQLTAVKKDDIYFFNINAAHVCHNLCESHKSQLTFNYNAQQPCSVHNKMQCLSLIKIYFIQWWIVLDISSQLIHMNEAINIFIRFPQENTKNILMHSIFLLSFQCLLKKEVHLRRNSMHSTF
jgi:hypothetical protein